jgi:predicted DCC family thiol-disulfide oxidoreductase YuxK
MGEASSPTAGDYLLYDGECPACSSVVAFSRLRQSHPSLQLLDARHQPELVEELRRAGYEINEGMVMRLGSRILFGGEVTAMMARLSTEPGRLRRAVMWTIGEAPWANALYPVLRGCRNLLLKLLGRSLIR